MSKVLLGVLLLTSFSFAGWQDRSADTFDKHSLIHTGGCYFLMEGLRLHEGTPRKADIAIVWTLGVAWETMDTLYGSRYPRLLDPRGFSRTDLLCNAVGIGLSLYINSLLNSGGK